MDWKDGNVTTATILSENGGEAVVQTKNASLATVVDSDGNVVDVTPVKENRISFATEAGKSYTLKDIPASAEVAAPTGLTALRADGENVKLSWDAVTAEEGSNVTYNVYRQVENGDVICIETGLTTTTYTDTTADKTLGTMKYQISAVVEGNESEKSAAVTAVEPVGAGKIDNADERIAYVGDWGNWTQDKNVNYMDTIEYLQNPNGGETATLTFKGTGTEPFFRSSVTMELDLKGTDTKDDINIFINRQKWEGEWDYEQSLKMTFYEEGNYEIHLVHKNGYEETRKITVELNNPSVPKIKSGSYSEGKWTSQNILLEAYGTKAVSKISHYEYRTGESEWKSMKKGMLEMKQDMDDIVLVRAVSNAGRYSEVQKIWCRLWKRNPNLSRITCSEKSRNGWYQKIPEFTYESEQTEGPVIHTYARLTQLQTGQTQTETDKIPKIKKDGKYQLKVWTKDEAGNRSENSFYTTCFVDTKRSS